MIETNNGNKFAFDAIKYTLCVSKRKKRHTNI